jgi:DNA-binding NarL/FixJ family response regulator
MSVPSDALALHLRNLSSKLDAHSKVEILVRAAELGLIAR